MAIILGADPLVDVDEGEEACFASGGFVDQGAEVCVGTHGFLAPPNDGAVLRRHVAIVRSAEVEVLQREEFLLCRSRLRDSCGEGHGECQCEIRFESHDDGVIEKLF